jgi:hypothetical protein
MQKEMTGLTLTTEVSLAWWQEAACPPGEPGVGIITHNGKINIIQTQNMESAGWKQGKQYSRTMNMRLGTWNIT